MRNQATRESDKDRVQRPSGLTVSGHQLRLRKISRSINPIDGEGRMKILDYALQMEADGKAYYEKLAKQATHPGLKTIFQRLAEDEQKHYEIFQKLISKAGDLAMQESTVLAETKNIFSQLRAGTSPPAGTEDSLAAYRHAMKLEAESCRLYEQAAAETPDSATQKLLLKIADEERHHFNILENIYLFISAPDQHPAWAESTNFDELS
jgi:rubrerythrin